MKTDQTSRFTKIISLILANGVNFLVNLITLPFLSRSLSYEEFGTYGQLLLINAILLITFGLGLPQILNIVYVENENKADTVFSTNFWICLISGVTSGILLYVFSYPIAKLLNNPEINNLIVYFIPTTIIQIAISTYLTTIVYFGSVKQLSIVTIFSNVIKLAGFFISIKIFNSLSAMLLTLGLTSLIQAIWYLILIPKKVRRFSTFDVELAKRQLTLGYPMLLTSLLGSAIFYLDGILVSNMLSVKDFAIYRNGAIEIPFLNSIYSYISTVILPDLAKYAKENSYDKIIELKKELSSITALITFPIILFFIFFNEFFIRAYLSDKYIDSAIIFAIYNVTSLVRINDYQDVLLVAKRSREILLINVFAFILNLLSNLILISIWGAIGAAIAYTLTLIVLAALLIVKSCKVINITVAEYFNWSLLLKILIGCSLVLLLSLAIYHWLDNSSAILLAITFFYFCGYFAILYLTKNKYALFLVNFLHAYVIRFKKV